MEFVPNAIQGPMSKLFAIDVMTNPVPLKSMQIKALMISMDAA